MKNEDQILELLADNLRAQDRYNEQLQQLLMAVDEMKKTLQDHGMEAGNRQVNPAEVKHLKRRIAFLEKKQRHHRS